MIVDILIKPEEDGAEIGTALARASSSSISFCFCCSRWARVGTMPASSRAAIPKYPADASWIGVGFSFPICHSLMMKIKVARHDRMTSSPKWPREHARSVQVPTYHPQDAIRLCHTQLRCSSRK